jgi:hypothetical protein
LPSLQPKAVVEDCPLISQDVLTDVADRRQVRRIRPSVGVPKLVGRDTDLVGWKLGSVKPTTIVEDRVEAAGGDIIADPLDDLPRIERLAKGGDRPRPAFGAHDIPAGAQLVPQCGERACRILVGAVDPANSQGHGRSF